MHYVQIFRFSGLDEGEKSLSSHREIHFNNYYSRKQTRY